MTDATGSCKTECKTEGRQRKVNLSVALLLVVILGGAALTLPVQHTLWLDNLAVRNAHSVEGEQSQQMAESSPSSLVGNNTCLEMGEWKQQMKNLKVNSSSQTRPLPIWLPAYPGSGSEVMRDLVIELTQNKAAAGESYMGGCQGAVTCKTHFPIIQIKNPTKNEKVSKQVVLLLRNPCSAIPSFFNYM
jgi:hypothetical protein